MRRFFYNMPGMFRTAMAFLLIFSCMVTASAASVRAEERMENEMAMETQDAAAGAAEETTGEGKEGAEEEDVENSTAPSGSFPMEEDAGGEEESLLRQETGNTPETDGEEPPETSASGKIPAGRRNIRGDHGTAYVTGTGGMMLFSTVNSECTITPGTPHSYGNWGTTEFYVVTDKGHYVGYCAQPNKPTPMGRYKISELLDDRIKMALMFGADGPWAGEASALFGGTADPYPYVHAMIGIEYTGETDGLTEPQIQAMRNALNELMDSGRASMSVFAEYKVYVAYNDDQDIVWLEYEGPVNGTLRLRKSSADPDITDGNPCYSLSGAEYGIYGDPSCTTQSGQFTTNEAGESEAVELQEGDYWVKELAAPAGYRKDSRIYPVHVKAGENTDLSVSDIPEIDPSGLVLAKLDQDIREGAPQGSASLAGTQFTLRYYSGYYGKDSLPQAPTRTWVLETRGVFDKADGPARYQALLREEYKVSGDAFYMRDKIPVLPLGTLAIEETKAPEGYLLKGAYLQAEGSTEKTNGPYVTQVIQTGDGAALKDGNQYTAYNQVIRGGVKVKKRDLDTGAAVPQGGASLENAVFSIVNLNENAVVVNGKAYNRNEEITVIRTDETGAAQTESSLLPYGKYRIVETGPPTGYLEKGVLRQEFFITEDGETVDMTDVEHSLKNRVKRGDFELRKIDSETQNVMPGVRFRLTSVTTGESHEIITDENGYYSSSADWNEHTHNTNQGGKEDGLWFGMDENGNSAPEDDTLGALPYDTYILEEIPTEANEGKEMLSIPFVIYKNKVTVNLGNLENKNLHEEEAPVISTSARNEATGNHYAAAGTVTIIDSVLCGGLKEKQEYRLKCTVMDKAEKEPVLDKEGSPVTAEKIFTPAASAGIAEVECTFDASELAGKDIVIYEELYENEKKIAEHKDISDEGQTIHFPGIRTRALDKENGTNTIVADSVVSIVDTVTYKNLKAGQEYTLMGKLMDKETGMPAKDAVGADVTAEVKFTPKEKDGKAEVVFTFDGTSLEGKTLVAFERLEKNGKEYAVHADLDSEEQTVYFPKVRTSARDIRTDSRSAQAAEDTVVVDTLFYSNLTPGQEYTAQGTLMDRETGEPLLEDGEKITAETTFTPEAGSGTVDVAFSFDATDLAGKTAVAFESVTQEGEEVAAHKDIDYEGQTIYFPEIGTKAGEKGSGSQDITAEKEITIVDTVSFRNLIPGEEYTVKGILMDKASGEPLRIEEKETAAEKTFVPEEENGTVEVEFILQAGTLKNKEVVVFEKLYVGETEIAAHEDLEDADQTVRVNMTGEKDTPSEKEKSVKTGDTAEILPAVMLLFLSLGVLIAAARRKIG